ncbi:hypothetical protein [Paenibacillus donghaensis]|uniref:Uncharacterized protein n=1 Tax=Paenibacillus donghaensis TaxID=414771 RepID=A0A2Z2KG19_9BACL|nr:hypothetical protein [Paenibacillus donghaensis]ASA25706.1 hypothetical protein B9T62_36255 [Paenibacillus donghaensis]
MSMYPYYTIIKESNYDENAGFQYFAFPGSQDTYVAVEHYCTNPNCECTSLILEINRVMPNGKAQKIGDITLRFPDYKIEMIEAKAPYQAKLKRQFKQGIPEVWKSYILQHRNHVREIIGAVNGDI